MSSLAPPSHRSPISSRSFPDSPLELALGGPDFKRGPLGWRAWLTIFLGATVALIGVALLVLPGPGTPLVIAGLAMLAPHWPWANRMLGKLRSSVEVARTKLRNRRF